MTPPRDLDFDLLTLMSAWESHVTCAKFRLPRPFGFRVRADVRDIRRTDRRTDGRRTPITALCPLGGGIIIVSTSLVTIDKQTDEQTGKIHYASLDLPQA